jgi:hypothetical protein
LFNSAGGTRKMDWGKRTPPPANMANYSWGGV